MGAWSPRSRLGSLLTLDARRRGCLRLDLQMSDIRRGRTVWRGGPARLARGCGSRLHDTGRRRRPRGGRVLWVGAIIRSPASLPRDDPAADQRAAFEAELRTGWRRRLSGVADVGGEPRVRALFVPRHCTIRDEQPQCGQAGGIAARKGEAGEFGVTAIPRVGRIGGGRGGRSVAQGRGRLMRFAVSRVRRGGQAEGAERQRRHTARQQGRTSALEAGIRV